MKVRVPSLIGTRNLSDHPLRRARRGGRVPTFSGRGISLRFQTASATTRAAHKKQLRAHTAVTGHGPLPSPTSGAVYELSTFH